MKKKPPKKPHQNVPASYLVLIKNEKIMLLRRANTGYEDGKYSFIAGHVDEGETFTQALIREAYEEAGVIVRPEDVDVAHIMHRKSPDSERVDVFFLAKNWEGEPENKEAHKCDDLSWFDLDDLPENVIPYIRYAIDCIRDEVYYSEHGWED